MNRQKWHKAAAGLLIPLLAFSMPFPLRWSSYIILALAANWLLSGDIARKLKSVYSDKVHLAFLIFFLFHAISILFSENQKEAWAILERRMPLLALPVLCDTLWIGDNGILKRIRQFFLSGLLVALAFCYAMAFNFYWLDGSTQHFYYHNFSAPLHIHSVYLSAYCVLGILIGLDDWRKENKWVYLLLPAFLLLAVLLLSSKIMFVALCLGLLLMFYKPVSLKWVPLALLFFVAFLGLFGKNLWSRYATEWSSDLSVISQPHYVYNTPFTGTTLRLVIWKQCYEVMKEENAWLTGTGTGDMQDILNGRYKQVGLYTGNVELKDTGYLGYGPHNEFVEVFFAMGVPALLCLFALFFLLFLDAVKHKNILYLQILVMLLLFCLSESVLSTNKGVVFFVYFIVGCKAIGENHRAESVKYKPDRKIE